MYVVHTLMYTRDTFMYTWHTLMFDIVHHSFSDEACARPGAKVEVSLCLPVDLNLQPGLQKDSLGKGSNFRRPQL